MTDIVGGSLGDSSLLLTKTQSSFDITDESQVILLLKLIHQSALDPDIKNHLRDLIFSYRQIRTDMGFKSVHDAFENFGVAITTSDRKNAPPETVRVQNDTSGHGTVFGRARTQPRFASSVVSKAKNASVLSEEKIPTADVTVEDVSIHTPMRDETAVSVPSESVSENREIPAVVKAVVEEPIGSSIGANTPISTAYVNASSRIKEIKSFVNERIGNPINLIDANNVVGREYMNALLDAMKKSNGGVQGELAQAMERLETAFGKVQTVILDGNSNDNSVAAVENAAEVREETPLEKTQVGVPHYGESAKEPPLPPIQEASIAQAQQSSAAQSATQVEHAAESQGTPASKTAEEEKELRRWGEVNDSAQIVEEVPPLRQQTVEIPINRIRSAQEGMQTVPVSEKTAVPPEKETASSDTAVHSVAKEKQLQDLMQTNREKQMAVNREQEANRVAAMDPLLTPKVDAGLGQLLSEWSLFKSSGVFGTGPSGRDHVLFKKLAPLPMAAIVAGRFEGATPKIKQSITDYMNGWRYEDGIIHEPAETFEHYLRRVVHYILDKQAKK